MKPEVVLQLELQLELAKPLPVNGAIHAIQGINLIFTFKMTESRGLPR